MNIESADVVLHKAFENICASHPSNFFIFHQDRSYTYQEVNETSDNFAAFLTSAGVKQNDKVCLILPRIPELIIAFLGSTKFGAVPAPVNYTLPKKEFNDFIRRVEPSAIIIHSDFVSQLESDIFSSSKFIKILVDGEISGFTPWREVCLPQNFSRNFHGKADDTVYLNFTTGSSGLPKGAIATNDNLYWNTRSAVETFEITENDVHLCMFASFAHPHEIFARAIYTGGSIVLLEKVNPKSIVKTINKYKVTCMMGLAPMYEMIATHCQNETLPSLRIAESGGMFTRPDIIQQFHHFFNVSILSVWGSTETSGIALANTSTNFKNDGAMGRACPYYDVRLVDDQFNEVDTGEVGELIFRGKGVIAGYAEKVPFPSFEGWYQSGDLAQKDRQGYYYFIERKSGMIKVAGLKVYPLQVEKVIQEHPDIIEIAVIGVKERRHGMIPKAFVATVDNITLTADDLRQFCKGKLPNYMIPKQLEILEELPKIGSGKINKKALIEMQEEKGKDA